MLGEIGSLPGRHHGSAHLGLQLSQIGWLAAKGFQLIEKTLLVRPTPWKQRAQCLGKRLSSLIPGQGFVFHFDQMMRFPILLVGPQDQPLFCYVGMFIGDPPYDPLIRISGTCYARLQLSECQERFHDVQR